MRVEVTFAGDAVGAQHATDQVADALKKLIGVADAAGGSLSEVKITSGQAAETAVNARRMQDSISGVGREADQTRRKLDELRLSAGRTGVGVGPFGSGFGRIGLLGAAVGGGTLVSGPAGLAALGGLSALPGLAAAGGAAVGVLALSFNGLGKAIDGNRQAFEKLDPEAQKFVQTVRSLEPWMDKLTETARGNLLPGISDALHSALTPANAGAIEQAISGISQSLAEVAQEWGRSLGSPQFTAGFSQLMTHAATWTREFGDAANSLAGALGKVTIAALPLDDSLVKALQHGSALLDNWIAQKQANGELAHTFAAMRNELEIVGRFLAALGGAVVSLARALTPLGNELLVGLTHALQNLSGWVDRNRQQIGDFATGALHALEAILNQIVPLLLDMGKAIVEVVNATGGWKTAFEVGMVGALIVTIARVKELRLALLALGSPEVAAAIGVAALALHASGTTPDTVVTATYKGKTLHAIMGTGGGDVLQKINSGQKLTAADITTLGALGAQGVTAKASAGSLQLPTSFAATHDTLGADWVSRIPGPDAIDLMASPGTAVKAPEDGSITRIDGHNPADAAGSASRGAWGQSFYFLGDSGTVYYGTHLSNVAPMGRYKKGDVIAIIGAYPGGGSHIHWAIVGTGAAALGDANGPSTQPATLARGASGGSSGGGKFTPTTGPANAYPFGTPEAFTATTKADLLPQNIRLAMALATTTGTATDNLAAARDAVAWLKAQIGAGAFTGEDLINAANELGALLQQVTDLRKLIAGKPKKPPRKPALATQAGVISAETYASGLLDTLGTSVFAATPPGKAAEDVQAQMTAALKALTQVQVEYKPKIEAIQKEISKGLADKTLTAADLATLRSRMGAYQQTITSAVSNAKAAVAAQQQSFQQVWQTMASDAVNAFNAQSDNFVPPAQMLLNQLNDAKTKEDLQAALDQANQQMADALNTVDNQAIVDSIKQTIGRYQQAVAVDAVQSSILGGAANPGAVTGGLLSDLQQQLVQNTVPDAQAVKAAQKAINDAQFQIKAEGLAAQAKQQQDAYNDMRASQLQTLNQMAGDWADYYNNVGGNIDAIKNLWLTALGAVDPAAAVAFNQTTNLQGGLTAPSIIVNGSDTGIADTAATASAMAAAAAAGMKTIIVNGVDTGIPDTPANARALALNAAQGNVFRMHADGGVFTRPSFLTARDVVAERGAEAVLPLTDQRAMRMVGDAIGGGGTTVELHGDLAALEPLISKVIVRRTPQISRALGQRTAARLKTHTY